MRKLITKRRIIVAIILAAMLFAALIGVLVIGGTAVGAMLLMGIVSSMQSGTWEDDEGNWSRAFGQDPPEDVSVVHSYYWTSAHFTHEYIYFFEVKASARWRDSFIKACEAEPVAASNAGCFEVGYDETPAWFVPGAVEQYDVWDRPGYRGSIWLNKTNQHFYFYGVQL